jgi:hypothetical protein
MTIWGLRSIYRTFNDVVGLAQRVAEIAGKSDMQSALIK